MSTLKQAHRELFRRSHDERFPTLTDLAEHCRNQKRVSQDRWHPPQFLRPVAQSDQLVLVTGNDGEFRLNDWSFSQLCKVAGVSRETVNRLTPETAAQVFRETMPTGQKPMQVLTSEDSVRSIHGVSYTRLWNIDLVNLVREFAGDFQPPQTAFNGNTGLYSGEQDMFCFLIDPQGWAEIDGQAFAPGFFVWNSEVGKRTVGISTFWFQKVCANHIVWDAIEVVEVTRKHTAGVGNALTDIRRTLESLIANRDRRRDGFVAVVQNAMREKLGADSDEVLANLLKNGIPRGLAKEAIEIARQHGAFTIFALVDAITRLAQQLVNIGDRLEMDQKAAALLALAA